MSDEQMQSVFDEWFEDTDPQPPNAQRIASRVLADVPQTRQRGRWLPFRLFRPKPPTPTATDTTEYQPNPIPATNGQTPTVIGRTSSMLSPVKAITAGAIVFALGGAFLISQPFDQQLATVPAAETDNGRAPTIAVTGTATMMEGPRQRESWETTDPRLNGISILEIEYLTPDNTIPGYLMFGRTLETDEGTWRQLPVPTARLPLEGPDGTREWTRVFDMVLIGEGEYEGLAFLAQATWQTDAPALDLDGYIVDADWPQELPE